MLQLKFSKVSSSCDSYRHWFHDRHPCLGYIFTGEYCTCTCHLNHTKPEYICMEPGCSFLARYSHKDLKGPKRVNIFYLCILHFEARNASTRDFFEPINTLLDIHS